MWNFTSSMSHIQVWRSLRVVPIIIFSKIAPRKAGDITFIVPVAVVDFLSKTTLISFFSLLSIILLVYTFFLVQELHLFSRKMQKNFDKNGLKRVPISGDGSNIILYFSWENWASFAINLISWKILPYLCNFYQCSI